MLVGPDTAAKPLETVKVMRIMDSGGYLLELLRLSSWCIRALGLDFLAYSTAERKIQGSNYLRLKLNLVQCKTQTDSL